MSFYHIRTSRSPEQTSLISNAEFSDDLAAAAGAMQLRRQGETLDVWRGEKLVYRIGLGTTSFARKRDPLATRVPIGLKSHLFRSIRVIFQLRWPSR